MKNDYTKAFDCIYHNKLRKILQEMGIPDHLCLLRNLYAGQEETVRTRCGTTDWFQLERSISRLYIVTLFIYLLCKVMKNARLDEAQARIKSARRNINSLRYSDDTTLIAESEEELKSLDESESGE